MLRDYQEKVINDIDTAFHYGANAVCAQMPTGAGKSVVLRKLVKRHKGYSCTIAHRQELVSQLSMHLATEGITHNIVAPKNVVQTIIKEHQEEFGRSYYASNSICHVASSQTLLARQTDIERWAKQCTLVLHDETHHLLRENAYGRAIAPFTNARLIGVTATPSRTDRKGLGSHSDGFFDALVTGPSMRQLIDQGHLSEYQIMVPKGDFDRSRLVIGSNGEFTADSLKKEAERSQIVGDVVQTWLANASHMQTIVFATDIETAGKIADSFKLWGIAAEAVSSKTPEYERFTAIKAFRERRLQILVNVALFDEGFDVPGVECVVMARPTQSLGLYLQSCGRALRPALGKTYALIIDHVSNVAEHGLPDLPRQWSLSSDRKRRKMDDEIPITTCTNCFRDYERSFRACPFCGAERETMPRGASSIEQVEGDLELLDVATLAAMRAAIQLESPASVGQRVALAAGEIAGKGAINRQIERIETQRQLTDAIALWAGYGRAKGKVDNQMHREFYFRYGCTVLDALAMPTAEMRRLIERIGSNES